jgi:hypothetical protein
MGENPSSGSEKKPRSGSSIVPGVDLSGCRDELATRLRWAVPGAIDASSVRRTIGASPDSSGTAAQIANHNSRVVVKVSLPPDSACAAVVIAVTNAGDIWD